MATRQKAIYTRKFSFNIFLAPVLDEVFSNWRPRLAGRRHRFRYQRGNGVGLEISLDRPIVDGITKLISSTPKSRSKWPSRSLRVWNLCTPRFKWKRKSEIVEFEMSTTHTRLLSSKTAQRVVVVVVVVNCRPAIRCSEIDEIKSLACRPC